MMETPAARPPLTWRHSAVIVLIIMAVGTLLALCGHNLLSPPPFSPAAYLYMIPALAWVPVLLYFGFRHPIGWRWIPVLLMLAGIVPILIALGLGFRAALLSPIDPTCLQQTLENGQIQYTCRISLIADSAI